MLFRQITPYSTPCLATHLVKALSHRHIFFFCVLELEQLQAVAHFEERIGQEQARSASKQNAPPSPVAEVRPSSLY